MTPTARRVVAATLTTMMLGAPTVVAAQAAPRGAAKHAKPAKPVRTTQASTQLLRSIAAQDLALDRLAGSKQTTRLTDANEAAVLANIAGDQVLLAQLGEQVALDAVAVRTTLRGFRVTNYVLATGILRQAELIVDEAVADPEAAAYLDAAVMKAQGITATSVMADIKAARVDLTAAVDELEDDTTE